MTAEHLKPLLDSTNCSQLFGEVATQFARGRIPEDVLSAVRMGRMTALQKPNGGVRGIVVGDVFRELVARTIAKQFAKQVEVATHLFQYALSTRAGTECVAHIVQALTRRDERAILLSVDGLGSVRFDCPWSHAPWFGGHARWRGTDSFRPPVLPESITVLVERRDG